MNPLVCVNARVDVAGLLCLVCISADAGLQVAVNMELGVVAGFGRGLLEERELIGGAGGICGLCPGLLDNA
jgi:hypothetical protein